jgi:hypothetical protein
VLVAQHAHEVGRWRGIIAGPFPSAPSQTVRAHFYASRGLPTCHALHLPPVILRPVDWLSQVPGCGVTHTTTTITLFPLRLAAGRGIPRFVLIARIERTVGGPLIPESGLVLSTSWLHQGYNQARHGANGLRNKIHF